VLLFQITLSSAVLESPAGVAFFNDVLSVGMMSCFVGDVSLAGHGKVAKVGSREREWANCGVAMALIENVGKKIGLERLELVREQGR